MVVENGKSRIEHRVQWWSPRTEGEQETFDSVKDTVKAILTIEKGGLTIDQLFRNLKEEMEVPYLSLGFKNFKELIFHMEDIAECRQHRYDPSYFYIFLKLGIDLEGAHINEMVAQQKTAPKKGTIPNGTRSNTYYVPFETVLILTESMYMRIGGGAYSPPPPINPPRNNYSSRGGSYNGYGGSSRNGISTKVQPSPILHSTSITNSNNTDSAPTSTTGRTKKVIYYQSVEPTSAKDEPKLKTNEIEKPQKIEISEQKTIGTDGEEELDYSAFSFDDSDEETDGEEELDYSAFSFDDSDEE